MDLTCEEFKAQVNTTIVRKAVDLVSAKAMVAVIRDVVHGYQTKILERHQFTNKAQVERNKQKGPQVSVSTILDPKKTYMMSDEDFAIYRNECIEEQKKAGLVTESIDQCPLLVAEEVERKARVEFIDAMAVITKMPFFAVLRCKNGLDKVYRLEELYLRMLASLGFLDELKGV